LFDCILTFLSLAVPQTVAQHPPIDRVMGVTEMLGIDDRRHDAGLLYGIAIVAVLALILTRLFE